MFIVQNISKPSSNLTSNHKLSHTATSQHMNLQMITWSLWSEVMETQHLWTLSSMWPMCIDNGWHIHVPKHTLFQIYSTADHWDLSHFTLNCSSFEWQFYQYIHTIEEIHWSFSVKQFYTPEIQQIVSERFKRYPKTSKANFFRNQFLQILQMGLKCHTFETMLNAGKTKRSKTHIVAIEGGP